MIPTHLFDKVSIKEESGQRIVEAPIADGIVLILKEDLASLKTMEVKYDESRYTESEAREYATNFMELIEKNLID